MHDSLFLSSQGIVILISPKNQWSLLLQRSIGSLVISQHQGHIFQSSTSQFYLEPFFVRSFYFPKFWYLKNLFWIIVSTYICASSCGPSYRSVQRRRGRCLRVALGAQRAQDPLWQRPCLAAHSPSPPSPTWPWLHIHIHQIVYSLIQYAIHSFLTVKMTIKN